MSLSARLLCACALVALIALDAAAEPRTVCTITVNSPDEKELLERTLPKSDFRFVELVERGRPDWLAQACRARVHCDVLVISGHFDGGTEFYTDRLDQREFLPVDEMERVACSAACPGLFSQLKEVYLFGCNTLNAEPLRTASAEVARSLVRSGHAPSDAERIAALLAERYAESNRDRMRNVFKDVPVIYGFSAKAPLGPFAASTLGRWLHAGGEREIGSGKASAKLLSLFAPSAMTVAAGATDADPGAGFREDVCRFADERLSPAQKLAFVHDYLHREMGEVRLFLDHIEKYLVSLTALDRQLPAVSRALAAIAADADARRRYLDFARDADTPAVRGRMLDVARDLGWLTQDELATEYARMIDERLGQPLLGATDVDLVCALQSRGDLEALPARVHDASASTDVGHAAVLACLGRAAERARVLRALTSEREQDVEIAQVYFRHRPLADASELRALTAQIAAMNAPAAQARALAALAGYRIADRESLETLSRLFPRAKSIGVQRAIAGVLLRSDFGVIATPALVAELRRHRVKSPDGADVVDALLRRMETSLQTPS